MQGRLLMMPSSSQVLDHQLIFHIMYGLRQFHHRQNKGEERRGEIQQKSNSCLTNIERKRCKKNSCCFPNIEDRKGGKKTTAAYKQGAIRSSYELPHMPELSLSCGMDCHTDFARSHMNIICLISSEPDRQIGQSEFSPIWRWNMTPLQGMNPLRSHQP